MGMFRQSLLVLLVALLSYATAWHTGLRLAVRRGAAAAIIALSPTLAFADAAEKQLNLPVPQFLKVVEDDITERQALATADFTRSIYGEDCTFTDEIDTYKIDEYVKGTKALFNGALSKVELTTPVTLVDDVVSYRFKETLAFKVPLSPKVDLTGKVELRRGKDGLIHRSQEFWDDGVVEVLQHIYF